ncbi:MAG: tricarballylate utilization 4Fe-4S protein TcuB [Pseudomonadota bacterium]
MAFDRDPHEAPLSQLLNGEELGEAERIMRICNACRYCEGLCAVFPGMEMRRDFAAGDLRHLANLCHNCGACYHDCQYAPPHEFAVNVPKTLAKLRARSWKDYAWPRAFAPLYERNGAKVMWLAALSVAVFLGGFMWAADPGVMFGVVTGPGAFYAIMPHSAMAGVFGAAFLWALVAFAMGFRNYWADVEAGRGPRLGRGARIADWRRALGEAAGLRHLDGGGMGCGKDLETTRDPRKLWHHMTFYGFLLCFAATCAATVMHYGLGWEAPYSWGSAPVLLGFVGGLGITFGPIGLIAARKARPEALGDETGGGGMDAAFSHMLAAVGATGLALLLLRETAAMGTLLALHLGFVFAFFVTMPYGRFVHGLYRLAALVRHAAEARGG